MSCAETSMTKRAEERRLFPVQFLSDYGTFTIAGITVTAIDAEGYPVTDDLIDETYNAFSGDTAQFMTMNGTTGDQYFISVAATMSDGEILIWEGTLTIVE